MKKTNREIDQEILNTMKDELELIQKVLPVFAIIIDLEKNEIIDFSRNGKIGNSNKKDSSHKHAEQKLLKSNKIDLNKKYKIIVNIPPCEYCMEKIHNSNVNVEIVEYIENYQLEKKLNDLFKEFSLKEKDLKYKLRIFNDNGYEELDEIKSEIVKHYSNFQIRTRLYIWYMVNFSKCNFRYVYIDKDEFVKFKTFFLIMNRMGKDSRKSFYKARNDHYKIRVDEIKTFISELDTETRKQAISNYKNHNLKYLRKLNKMKYTSPELDDSN